MLLRRHLHTVRANLPSPFVRLKARMRLLADFGGLLTARFRADRCTQVAGSLTFTTLLALVPLITVGVALLTAFPVFAGFSRQLENFIVTNLVPAAATKVITVYTQQFAVNAGRLTALGTALLAATALSLMLTIDRAFNLIWRVRRPRPLVQRLSIYWAVLSIGPLLLGASLSLTSWLMSVSTGFTRQIPAVGVVMLAVVPIGLTAIAFTLLYLNVPYRRVRPGDAVLGGVVAGIAFEVMKRAFAFYVARFPNYTLVYGAFASVPIFLLWIYLSWLVILFGAEIVAVLPQWRAGDWKRKRFAGRRFYDALEIMRAVCAAQARGEPVTLARLHRELRAGIDDVEAILEELEAGGILSRIRIDSWVMLHAAERVRVADIYRLFLFCPEAALSSDARLASLLGELDGCLAGRMQMSLKELFAAPLDSPGGSP